MAFGIGAWTRANISGQSQPTPPERDEDLENTLGNLLIAKYQVMRLEKRLTGEMSIHSKKQSSFMFKRSGEWYKISLMVEREPKSEQDKTESEEDPNPNNNRVVTSLPYPMFLAGTPISGLDVSGAWSSVTICGDSLGVSRSTRVSDDDLIIQ